jgi:hypothetical protein
MVLENPNDRMAGVRSAIDTSPTPGYSRILGTSTGDRSLPVYLTTRTDDTATSRSVRALNPKPAAASGLVVVQAA